MVPSSKDLAILCKKKFKLQYVYTVSLHESVLARLFDRRQRAKQPIDTQLEQFCVISLSRCIVVMKQIKYKDEIKLKRNECFVVFVSDSNACVSLKCSWSTVWQSSTQ